ncbi:MAG: sulfur carrier protein ThiS [Bryobacteraceae bacterium]|nr:sulfur carrier protein ThiS [Bryobacteraceae bacterium]MDW8380330.1 sulfur carrier protein ThiS [Bryobacterales bacterium]
MEILVNGEVVSAPEDATLQTLIETVGLDPSRVAVELNGEIVRRANWATTRLSPGSKVELVQFVGGG